MRFSALLRLSAVAALAVAAAPALADDRGPPPPPPGALPPGATHAQPGWHAPGPMAGPVPGSYAPGDYGQGGPGSYDPRQDPRRDGWMAECRRRMDDDRGYDRRHRRDRDDWGSRYCEDTWDSAMRAPAYGYGYAAPVMMVPMMMTPAVQQAAPAQRVCKEVVSYEYVDVPVRRRVIAPRPKRVLPDKRVRIVPDKRVISGS